jgi:hypothetical protein
MYCDASVPARRAINSEPKVLDSTVCCLLLYHKIGALSTKNKKPVCDLRVFLLATCKASTNSVIVTGRPLGRGMSCGIGSSASRYCSQLADTFTEGLALEQFSFSILRHKLMGWTAEVREGVSKVELTKYLWSLLGTARPLVCEQANDEVRQLRWWKDTEGTVMGRKATSSYVDCEHEPLFEPD